MTSRACIAAVLSSVCAPAFAVIHSSDNNPSVDDLLAPKPAWVERATFPAPIGGDAVSLGTEWLLDDRQYYLDGDALQEYRRIVLAVATPAGLSEAANWEITWSPPFERLAIHRILVRRGSETLSAFDLRRVHIARREADFEELKLYGELSALLTLDDIRAGDIVDIEWTTTGQRPILDGRFSTWHSLRPTVPKRRIHVSINARMDADIKWRVVGTTPLDPTSRYTAGRVAHDWTFNTASDVRMANPQGPPPDAHIQVSDWADWSEVAQWACRNFASMDEPGPAVRALADRLRRENATPEQRILAATRFVEDEVRYLAECMAEAGLRPDPPDSVLRRRAGDCKGKTTLLVALLREMDIDAAPALVNTDHGNELVDFLPRALAFDHVVTCVRLDGEIYWIDATRLLDRNGLAASRRLHHGHALIVEPDTTGLKRAAWCPSWGSSTKLHLRLSAPVVGERVRLDIRSIYSGSDANRARRHLAGSSLNQVIDTRRRACGEYWKGVQQAAAPRLLDDQVANVVSITESWYIDRFWRHDRAEGAWKGQLDIPHAATALDTSGLSDDARDALLPSSSRAIRVTCMALLPDRARSSEPDVEIDGESIMVARRAEAEGSILRLDRDLDVSWSGPGPVGDARHAAEERDALNQLSIDVQVDDVLPLWLVGATADERLHRLVGAVVGCLILLLIVRVRGRLRDEMRPLRGPPARAY